MSEPSSTMQTVNITWRGTAILITYEANWLNLHGMVGTCAHLAINAEGRRRLPFTETGYRSCFLTPTEVDAVGGPVAYVLAWLDAAAESPQWKVSQMAGQQLTLF